MMMIIQTSPESVVDTVSGVMPPWIQRSLAGIVTIANSHNPQTGSYQRPKAQGSAISAVQRIGRTHSSDMLTDFEDSTAPRSCQDHCLALAEMPLPLGPSTAA